MASERIFHQPLPAPDPTSGTAELIYGNIKRRRKELEAIRGGAAVQIAARALAALYRVVHGAVPSIRADRQERLRSYQIAGERGLPSEDIVAIGLEGDIGRAAVVAWLRVVAEAFGFYLTPMVTGNVERQAAAADMSIGFSRASIVITEALRDGSIDDLETHEIARSIDEEVAPRVERFMAAKAAGKAGR